MSDVETAQGARVSRVRVLSPIWEDSAKKEKAVVMRCAQAFAEAFAKNPAAPRLGAVAKNAGCSRNAVKGHLATAQRSGLLALTVRLPRDEGLSQQLAQKYGLAEAVVTPTATDPGDQSSIRPALAVAVIRYLERFSMRFAEANPHRTEVHIGIDGGQTLYQAVRGVGLLSLPRLRYELVPLVFGPLGEGAKYTASIVANVLASKIESAGPDVLVRDGFSLRADWKHAEKGRGQARFTVEMTGKRTVSQLDLFLVGIGSRKAGLLQREIDPLPPRMRARHCGDIVNLAFDQKGRALALMGRSRAALLSLSDLQRMSRSASALVVGAAGGREKIDSIRTVLRCGYISVLITDVVTAAALVSA
jgi:DNA-binding transcriptional regulator LsrR (DeoR family)